MLGISIVINFLVIAGIALAIFYMIMDRRRVQIIRHEARLQDARVIARLAQQSMHLPSSAIVLSKFANLRFNYRTRKYMEDLAVHMDTEFHDLLNRVENKFVRIDNRIFDILQLVQEDSEDEENGLVSQISNSHEAKYKTIMDHLETLNWSKNSAAFLYTFTDLNDFLNSYLEQIESQNRQLRRLQNPFSYQRMQA